jgi:hypothetical protein
VQPPAVDDGESTMELDDSTPETSGNDDDVDVVAAAPVVGGPHVSGDSSLEMGDAARPPASQEGAEQRAEAADEEEPAVVDHGDDDDAAAAATTAATVAHGPVAPIIDDTNKEDRDNGLDEDDEQLPQEASGGAAGSAPMEVEPDASPDLPADVTDLLQSFVNYVDESAAFNEETAKRYAQDVKLLFQRELLADFNDLRSVQRSTMDVRWDKDESNPYPKSRRKDMFSAIMAVVKWKELATIGDEDCDNGEAVKTADGMPTGTVVAESELMDKAAQFDSVKTVISIQ